MDFERVRDGWVLAYEAVPPTVKVLVSGGRVQGVVSDVPSLRLEIVDADTSGDPGKVCEEFAKKAQGFFAFEVDKALMKV